MSDQALIQRLEQLPEGADFTDPATYAALLGYDEQGAAAASQEVQQQAETAPAAAQTPAAPAAAPAPAADSSAPAGAAQAVDEANVAGVATRDGKHVIPFSVLEATRTARQAAEAQAQQLANELQQLREANQRLQEQVSAGAGAKQDQADSQAAALQRVSQEKIESVRIDFPELAEQMEARNALIDSMQAMQQRLEQIAATRPQPAATQQPDTATLQELIDQRPLLAQWQAKGGVAWREAVARDNALQSDPAWATKPMAERFAEVERQLAAEFGIAVPAPAPRAAAPSAQPAAAAQQPNQQPKPAALPTLTDLSGTPAVVGDPTQGMSTNQMVDMARNMSMEELRKLAGLSY